MFPPGSKAPGLYQIGRWIIHPLKLLDECHQRYGDVFTLSAPRGEKFVIVGDPDLIKQVLTSDPATLLAGQGNATLLEPMLGKFSLLTLDGADHLRQRRLLLPAFHGERMKAYSTVMAETTESSLERWPMHQPFALHSMMQEITLDVILRTVFGVSSSGDLRGRLLALLEVATNPWLLFPGLLGLSPLSIPWLKIAKLKAAVDESIYGIIASRRHKPTGGADVLSMMLDARDEQGAPMSDVEVRDELVTLLLAGHETTATALAWTFDRLLAHPQVLAKLRASLLTGGAGREEYLDCVIRESLRVRPIVPLVGRVAVKPYQLGQWMLPAGTRIAPSIYLAGHRAAAYPNPRSFDPDRWIGVKPDPYTWLPFGGGTRRCIGMAFAQAEMRLVLQSVVLRTRMRLADGPAAVVRRGITLAPANGTRVILEERTRHATAA